MLFEGRVLKYEFLFFLFIGLGNFAAANLVQNGDFEQTSGNLPSYWNTSFPVASRVKSIRSPAFHLCCITSINSTQFGRHIHQPAA